MVKESSKSVGKQGSNRPMNMVPLVQNGPKRRAKSDKVGYRAANAMLTVQSVAGFSDSCARVTYSETNNRKKFLFYK